MSHKNYRWTGCGELRKTYFSSLIIGTQRRNIKFDITIEEIWNLFLEQKGICKLSGRKLILCDLRDKAEYNASIDRIDSNKGYTKDNIVLCCFYINKMKNNLETKDFVEICKIIADRFT